MTNSGLATPPRALEPRGRRPAAPPPMPPGSPGRQRDPYRRVLGWSLGLSALFHFLFLVLPTFQLRPSAPAGTAVTAASPSGRFGMEMIIAIPTEGAPDLPPVQEAETPPASRTPPQAQLPNTPSGGGARPSAAPGVATPPRSGLSVEEALQAGYQDSRLYVPVDEFPELRKTDHERYMEHFQARIDAVNDSMGVASARNRRTSDWTVTDGSGNRWGLSPEGLHLGGITVPRALIPLPAPTGDNQMIEAERERNRQREEIQRQAGDAERDDTSRERIEAIRDSEDARRQGGGS